MATALRAEPPLIYREGAIGSDATFNPLSHYFNLAFDTTQNPIYFTQSGYFSSHARLWERIRDPIRSIEDGGGFGKLVKDEIIGMRAVPNYTLHLLGGGYDYRWLAEWYESIHAPAPYVLAFLNSYLANIGNEAIETTATQVGAHDHIADLFFFDIAGKILFTSDPVVRFFRDTLEMRAWHLQPMLNLRYLRIDNAGSNYIFRPRLFGNDWRPFIHMGLSVLGGVSWRFQGDDSISVAAGVVPTDPLALKGDVMFGVYWDRKDALLASATFNGSSKYYVRLNVYPDVVPLSDFRTGFFAAFSKNNEVFLGININMLIGASASF